jgi:hypothetical protein
VKRLTQAAALTFAAGVAVLGTAGGAMAHNGGGASAEAAAIGSPGVLSGNVIQVPLDIPINACGNSVNIILAIANPAIGNTCVNSNGHHHEDGDRDHGRSHDNNRDHQDNWGHNNDHHNNDHRNNNWGHNNNDHHNGWGHNNNHNNNHNNDHHDDHNHGGHNHR